jgi:hypothetical protein
MRELIKENLFMILRNWLCLLCGIGALSGTARAQCYDLTSARLYDLKGRFQERWDRPIWDAKPGEGNFHLDESPWFGGTSEFVIFSIGQVQKTESGWQPFTRTKIVDQVCSMNPQGSDIHCSWPPYEPPDANSKRMPARPDFLEVWTLTQDGILHFTVSTPKGPIPLTHVDPQTDALIRLLNQNEDLGSTFEATLDLNNGAYSAVTRGHGRGLYRRHFPDGIELWRDTSFSGRAKFPSQTCTASMQRVALDRNITVRSETAHPIPICVIRARSAEPKPPFEFILNPMKATSAQGCVIASDAAFPLDGVSQAAAAAQR